MEFMSEPEAIDRLIATNRKPVVRTAGPWTVVPTTSEVFTAGNHIRIVQTTTSPNWHEAQKEMLANAHLIAAAPDLLAACKDVAAWLREFDDRFAHPTQTAMRAICDLAIAKAEGR